MAKPVLVRECGTDNPNWPTCPGHESRSSGFAFFALNIQNGSWAPLFTFDATDLNRVTDCDISPIDSRVYCVAGFQSNAAERFYVIRVGAVQNAGSAIAPVQVLAKLKGLLELNRDYPPKGAGFAPGGSLHISVEKWGYKQARRCCGQVLVLDGDYRVDRLQGFSDYSDAGVADLPSTAVGNFTTLPSETAEWVVGDVGVLSLGGSDIGFAMDWKGNTMWAYRRDPFEKKPLQLVAKPGSTRAIPEWKQLSVWVYENRIMMASGNSSGVWMPEVDSFDFATVADHSAIKLQYLGPSNVFASEGGLNCKSSNGTQVG